MALMFIASRHQLAMESLLLYLEHLPA